MCNAFYLFRLPQPWVKYLCFNILRKGKDIGHHKTESVFCLGCQVLPMGWNSSVAIMQEVSENILYAGDLSAESQLARGCALPGWMVGLIGEARARDKAWWHVYLDNFCAGEVAEVGSTFEGGKDLHDLAEQAWPTAGVISSEGKRKRVEIRGQELGAYLDGSDKCIGGSPERMLRLVQATLWLLGRKHLSKKLTQVIAGRWIHVLQFRRPGMVVLEKIWEYITSKGVRADLMMTVRQELFQCLSLVPLLHTFLGADISADITASDASQVGGAVGISRDLTEAGRGFVGSVIGTPPTQKAPIMVLSLFNGIGGALRCYDVLGIIPEAILVFDTHPPANRVISRRWPAAEIFADVRSIDKGMIDDWFLKYPQIREVHLWGGFPCTDLSSAKANAEGLAGEQSSLFFEIPRIRSLLEAEAPPDVEVKIVIENVASMPKPECQTISSYLGLKPYHLNCADAVPMQRPRLCWTTEQVAGALGQIEITEDTYWDWITAKGEYPPVEAWIRPGYVWAGEQQAATLPTAMKSIPRQRPPPRPAGLHRCDLDCQARWASHNFRFPPYHYLPQFLFWKDSCWRLADSTEKELLLGYGYQHTKLCYSASKIKQFMTQYEDERLSLLGDSFSVVSFVIIAAALCRRYMPKIPYSNLLKRMGLSPGFTTTLRVAAPLQRGLCYGIFDKIPGNIQDLNRILLTRTNHTGSDVKISTGEFLNPKAAVRQSIEAAWWQWEHVFRVRWQVQQHINILELRSILLAVKFHIFNLHKSHARIFHVTDSYICMSVVAKGRSGSRQLNKVLRQLNAHLLGFGIYIIIAHVESSENPTDHASRQMAVCAAPFKSRARPWQRAAGAMGCLYY